MRKVRPPLSPLVAQTLATFGAGLKDLRRRRRISMAQGAETARISRATLHKMERGDPGVSLGIYATVMEGYGMLERIAALTDVRYDRKGLALEAARLPQRIRG